MPGYILYVEDDPEQAREMIPALRERHPDLEVTHLETECAFYGALFGLPAGGGNLKLVICDMMLPYCALSSDPDPKQTTRSDMEFMSAGNRCWSALRHRKDLGHIPWLYYTILDEATAHFGRFSDISTSFVQKSADIRPLFEAIDELWALKTPPHGNPVSRKDLQILLGGKTTPLSACAQGLPGGATEEPSWESIQSPKLT